MLHFYLKWEGEAFQKMLKFLGKFIHVLKTQFIEGSTSQVRPFLYPRFLLSPADLLPSVSMDTLYLETFLTFRPWVCRRKAVCSGGGGEDALVLVCHGLPRDQHHNSCAELQASAKRCR